MSVELCRNGSSSLTLYLVEGLAGPEERLYLV